jgi:hypothetical protein
MEVHDIRRSQPADCPVLVALWERSVRATHGFLAGADIAHYRPLVAEILAGDSLELWVLTDTSKIPIGFLGLSAHAIEALFLEPAVKGEGTVAAWFGTYNNSAADRSPSTSTKRMTPRAVSTRRSDS